MLNRNCPNTFASMRFSIVPVSESIFQKIDERGCFTNEKMSTQELYDCSWNFDRLLLRRSENEVRPLIDMQNDGALNAYACIDTEKDYPVAFFTLAATSLNVPPEFRETGKDLNWDNYPSIQIDYLFVDKDLQHHGVGSYILSWIKLTAKQRRYEFEAYRFLFLNAIMTEQAIRFYKKNDFIIAEEDDQMEIEQSLENGLFVDDKECVVPMFFDLNSLA